MAEEFAQEKTEQPSQRRRDESRDQGQVAFSTELNSGVLLFAAALVLWLAGSSIAGGIIDSIHHQLQFIRPQLTAEAAVGSLLGSATVALQGIAIMLAASFFTGLGVSAVQAGLHVSSQALSPNWNRINPAEGMKKIFSMAGVMKGMVAVLKVLVIAGIFYWVITGRATQIGNLAQGTLTGSAVQTWNIAIGMILGLSAALVLVGLLDFAFQKYRHEQKLMMSRQELKEELKRDEGDPHLRGRRRARAREVAARQRMLEEVPKATVVITNPTHLAVALLYKTGETDTPKVVAKGAGEIARAIVERARRHAVPVVERKPLAQALFKTVKVGADIPIAMFVAVSQVLAYIYQLKGSPEPAAHQPTARTTTQSIS